MRVLTEPIYNRQTMNQGLPRVGVEFMWNEPAEHWLELERVWEIGGSFTANWDEHHSTGFATVSIWGVKVIFHIGDYGVNFRPDRIMVRADVFYNKIVCAAQEMVFLGGHYAFGRTAAGLHVYLTIFVSPESEYYDTRYFSRNSKFGFQYATLGGGVMGTRLRSHMNRLTDISFCTKRLMQHLYSGTDMVNRLMKAHHYSLKHRGFYYNPFAGLRFFGAVGFNSNSILSGLLHAIGFHPGEIMQKVIGWNKPVPICFFRQS